MTREEWKTLHRDLRLRRFNKNESMFYALRDSRGFLGVTLRHENGHIVPRAAHVGVLFMASCHRRVPGDHAIYLAKAKALRKYGTWFGRL